MTGADRISDGYGPAFARKFRSQRQTFHLSRTIFSGGLAVTELRDDSPPRAQSDPIAKEDAFVFTVMLQAYTDGQTWVDGVPRPMRSFPANHFLLNDLRAPLTVLIDQPHHSISFYIPRRALDIIADQENARSVDELNLPLVAPIDDRVIACLAQSITNSFWEPEDTNPLFLEHVMTATAAHVARAYGGLRSRSRRPGMGLAAWRERRAKEMLREKLDGTLSLGEVAAACGMSVSHFSRCFRETTGCAPHQWVLRQRIELAKGLILDERLSMAEVALASGFANQSHLTRTFSRVAGVSPVAWRRRIEAESDIPTCRASP